MKIELLEQPSEYHRFRYETEVSNGKLGGLLYGRTGNRSHVRLRVSGIDPLLHKSLIIIGATINSDLLPHPYFMVGDNCSNGAFQLKKDVDSLSNKSEFEFALEKVSLVCVSTKGAKLQEAIENRKKINFNPFNKNMDEARYNSRNLKSIRLVFQVFYTDYNDQHQPTNAIVTSDVITDSNADITSFKAELQAEAHGSCPCTVKVVKKHLLVISKPDASNYLTNLNERNKCHLVITDTRNGITDHRDVILFYSQQDNDPMHLFWTDAPQKRKRATPSQKPVVNMDEFLQIV
uniref:RHD domain-containing protein n=1 Tax=Macrostomum lignano TaxID=282301 RepID=A0A1I8JG43_9PLAT